jgi:hypothetical protein
MTPCAGGHVQSPLKACGNLQHPLVFDPAFPRLSQIQSRWSELSSTRWFGAASPQRVGVNAFHLTIIQRQRKIRFDCMVRDSANAKIPILLDLVARSSVADFGYLPLVNALVGSLAGATISA